MQNNKTANFEAAAKSGMLRAILGGLSPYAARIYEEK